jgi:hypothetical protein
MTRVQTSVLFCAVFVTFAKALILMPWPLQKRIDFDAVTGEN